MLEDTDRLLGTVEQVLKAGEARHGKVRKQQWQEIDLASIVKDALQLASLRHGLQPAQMRFGPKPATEVTLMGSPEELRTAIANLLDNAVKYSGEDKEIVVDILTPNVDTAAVRVRDNGIGIPRNELKRIFRRFYRVESTGNGHVKGTGLGLSIVQSIARRHGGDVIAESDGEGRGSTFTLRFPRVYRV
jgi:two-component system sensor histidine kinase SenX3